jgi:hypothetical protein
MKADIYYADETQDDYGIVNKKWIFDESLDCSLYTLGDKSNENNFSFDDKVFYKLETMLFGRFRVDPRKSSSGLYFPLSHILISSIRGATCNDEIFFVETNGTYSGKPTVYEVKTCQPFVGPFNTTEYYKIQLERSDIQGLNKNAPC